MDIVYLIEDHPVGVNLRVSLWVQHHGLIDSEVSQRDLSVLWAVVDYVDDTVVVSVVLALISLVVSWHTMTHVRNHKAETQICTPPCSIILTV